MFRIVDLFPFSGEWRETLLLLQSSERQWPCLALSKGHNRIGFFLPLPEEGRRSIFLNVLFYAYLDFHTIDKPHKPSNSKCYTSSPEPIFWDVASCGSCTNQHCGEKANRLSHQGDKNRRTTRRNIPEDGILNNHHCENIQSYRIL
jgi:hypothetical protein